MCRSQATQKLIELIEQTFNREGSLYLACNDKSVFSLLRKTNIFNLLPCKKVRGALHNNIIIRLRSKLFRQIVGIPMGTNCAPLVADLFFALLCCLFLKIIRLLRLRRLIHF